MENNNIGCLSIIILWFLFDLIGKACFWSFFDMQIPFSTVAMWSLSTIAIGVLGYFVGLCFLDYKNNKGQKDSDNDTSKNKDDDGKEKGKK